MVRSEALHNSNHRRRPFGDGGPVRRKKTTSAGRAEKKLPNIQTGVSCMNAEQVELFRKMAAQLDALHQEATAASKKHPDKPVSKFKVDLANAVLEAAKGVLG